MTQMTKDDIFSITREQLALELNCKAADFLKEENIITAAALHEKRRKFSEEPFYLQTATFGNNAVISADEEMHQWLKKWANGKRGFWLFEQHNFFELECELRKHGYKMAATHHMFLPRPEIIDFKTDIKIKWLGQNDFADFYGKPEFSNALCDRFRPERPDVLAIAALDGEKIIGMAGCSADTPVMWQIGIDVLPEYRGRGVGTALVTLIRNETFRRGALPYYGTSLSNLGSWKIALASGFAPAWIEVETQIAQN
ncbi:MAG: GNAT family N-acetyltransferase [Spirochaetaceae bacterium]|nr:GNAT family N-acetyltransferase [Spirochaetaceae bacterium]